MEFGMKKCGTLTIKRGNVVRCEGIKLPNSEVMNKIEKEGYTYLNIVELDKIKENEMKEKATKEYKQRLRLVLKSKLNGRNKITAINACVVAVFRYGAGILHWKEIELKDVHRKLRKTMTMYGVLRPKSDEDRLYIKREERGRGLISGGLEVRGLYIALEKWKIVWVFMLPILKESLSGELLQLRQSILKIL